MSNKEKLAERWEQGRISEAMLRVYVRKGILSKAEFEEICGKKGGAEDCEYRLRRDSTRQLSPSFKVREFGCKGSDVVLLDEELVVLLQCIREHFGKPLHITSGYRTAAHNAAVGGSKSSQHLLGRAADFWVEDTPVASVAAYAETLLPGRGGIGRYPKDAAHPKRRTGWVHLDTRANKSRWSM